MSIRQTFVNRTLEILYKRRQEVFLNPNKYLLSTFGMKQSHKNFNETEFCLVTGFNWDGFINGTTRFPDRHDVITIGQYLECSQIEAAELMAMAGYIPEELPSNGFEFNNAIPIRKEVLDYLRQPGYVLTRDWNIIYWNSAIIKILGLESIDLALKNMSPNERNLLRLIFDTDLPVRDMIAKAKGQTWEAQAVRNIHAFILDNILNIQEDWYKEILSDLKTLPRFEELYDNARATNYRYAERMEFVTIFSVPKYNKDLALRSNFIRLGNANYPQITFFTPANNETETIFRMEGFL
jgi:hypothetical protein